MKNKGLIIGISLSIIILFILIFMLMKKEKYGSILQLTSTGDIKSSGLTNDTLRKYIIDKFYPINSIYISDHPDISPNSWGVGRWGVYGRGRVLVGAGGTNGLYSSTLEGVGGSTTATIPITGYGYDDGILDLGKFKKGTNGQLMVTSSSTEVSENFTVIGFANTSPTISTLQPYTITTFWKRVDAPFIDYTTTGNPVITLNNTTGITTITFAVGTGSFNITNIRFPTILSITIVGGGGGGGGGTCGHSNYRNYPSTGSGGGGGGVLKFNMNASVNNLAIVVGAGGKGGTTANATINPVSLLTYPTNGGLSSLNNTYLIANGGNKGTNGIYTISNSTSTKAIGGTGGTLSFDSIYSGGTGGTGGNGCTDSCSANQVLPGTAVTGFQYGHGGQGGLYYVAKSVVPTAEDAPPIIKSTIAGCGGAGGHVVPIDTYADQSGYSDSRLSPSYKGVAGADGADGTVIIEFSN